MSGQWHSLGGGMVYPATCSAFNDREVIIWNRTSESTYQRKMAECIDYPHSDLADFYDQLKNAGPNPPVTRWAKKAGKFWKGLKSREFRVYRRRKQ